MGSAFSRQSTNENSANEAQNHETESNEELSWAGVSEGRQRRRRRSTVTSSPSTADESARPPPRQRRRRQNEAVAAEDDEQEQRRVWWRRSEADPADQSAEQGEEEGHRAPETQQQQQQQQQQMQASGATFATTQHGHRVLRQALETVLLNLIHEQRLLRIQQRSQHEQDDDQDEHHESSQLRVDSFYFYGRFLADWVSGTQQHTAGINQDDDNVTYRRETSSHAIPNHDHESEEDDEHGQEMVVEMDSMSAHHDSAHDDDESHQGQHQEQRGQQNNGMSPTLIDLEAFEAHRANHQTVLRRQWINGSTFTVELATNTNNAQSSTQSEQEQEENRATGIPIPLMIIGTHDATNHPSAVSVQVAPPSNNTGEQRSTMTRRHSAVSASGVQPSSDDENQPSIANRLSRQRALSASIPASSSSLAAATDGMDNDAEQRPDGQISNSNNGWIMYVVGGPSTGEALGRLQTQMNEQEQRERQRVPPADAESSSQEQSPTTLQPRIIGLEGRLVLLTNRMQLASGGGDHGPTGLASFLNQQVPDQAADNDTQQPPANPAVQMNALLAALLAGVSDGDMRQQLGLNNQLGRAGPDGPVAEDDTHWDTYELFLRIAELIGPARVRSVPLSAVQEQLPSMTYTAYCKSCAGSALTTCPICLGPFQPNDELRLLKCQHGYHSDCIDAWLCQHVNSCPLCRTEAVTLPASGSSSQ